MPVESETSGESPSAASTIAFSCAKCGMQNHLAAEQKDLLFGGGGVQPPRSSAESKVRTLIVRCSECQHANRISLRR